MLTVEELKMLFLSLCDALCCIVVTLPLAVTMGWLLARCNFPLKQFLDGLFHLPLVLSPLVLGRNIGDHGHLSAGFTSPFSICRTGRGRLKRPCARGAQCGCPEIPCLFDQDHDPVHDVRSHQRQDTAPEEKTAGIKSGSRTVPFQAGVTSRRIHYG